MNIFYVTKQYLNKYLINDSYVLGLLIFLAFASRIYGIWEWTFVGDEYPTVEYAAERYNSLINPAYYVLVLGSFELFGVNEWSARFPAFILGVAGVPVIYLICHNIFNRNIALIAALLTIFSSWHLFYSQFSRFYTGVFLFGSLAYFFYYKAINKDNIKFLIWGMIANLIAISFHLTSVLIAASFAVFCALILFSNLSMAPLLFSESAVKSTYSKRIAFIFLAITVIGGLLLLPFLWDKLTARGQLAIGMTGPLKLILQLVRDVQIPLAISALFGLLVLTKKNLFEGSFFAVSVGIPLLIVMFGSMFAAVSPRYLFYILPLVIVLSAILCDEAMQTLKSYNYQIASHAITVIVIVCMLPQTVSYYTGQASLDFRDVVAYVEKNYKPGDKILSYVQGGRRGESGFNRYAEKNYVLEERYGVHPHFNTVDWQQTMQNYEDDQQRMWIMVDTRRRPLAKGLENWLMNNASLVWRRLSTRYDQDIQGYEIWLMNGNLSN